MTQGQGLFTDRDFERHITSHLLAFPYFNFTADHEHALNVMCLRHVPAHMQQGRAADDARYTHVCPCSHTPYYR